MRLSGGTVPHSSRGRVYLYQPFILQTNGYRHAPYQLGHFNLIKSPPPSFKRLSKISLESAEPTPLLYSSRLINAIMSFGLMMSAIIAQNARTSRLSKMCVKIKNADISAKSERNEDKR